MAAVNWFKYSYLAYLAKPGCDRELYRLIKRKKARRIVELGIESVERSIALIEVAQRYAEQQKVCYTGLDWFDTRSIELPTLTLKLAYRALQATSANVRLVPGIPGRSLETIANSHQNTDLILISQSNDDCDLNHAWFFIPRMLHQTSSVLREQNDSKAGSSFVPLTLSEIAERAGRNAGRRAA